MIDMQLEYFSPLVNILEIQAKAKELFTSFQRKTQIYLAFSDGANDSVFHKRKIHRSDATYSHQVRIDITRLEKGERFRPSNLCLPNAGRNLGPDEVLCVSGKNHKHK